MFNINIPILGVQNLTHNSLLVFLILGYILQDPSDGRSVAAPAAPRKTSKSRTRPGQRITTWATRSGASCWPRQRPYWCHCRNRTGGKRRRGCGPRRLEMGKKHWDLSSKNGDSFLIYGHYGLGKFVYNWDNCWIDGGYIMIYL